jgi:ubiquinone/menaquinone biosynthesis C-methylase UbiE
MGFWEAQVLPRAMDKLLGNEDMAEVRKPSLVGLSGVVVELGFGSGPNVPLYPAEVERVLAVDPAIVGRKLAARRVEASPIPVSYLGLDGESLPLDDEAVDAVLSTWTLCTIPDVDQALQEAKRVLRPGGRLFFLEHGLSTDPKIAHRQHRLTPWQKRIAGGCHLDRDIEDIVVRAGFELERMKRFTISGPKSMSAMYSGVGVKPA